jgi:23S rRNA (uracil1939-C5)-methyltransferase
MKKPETNATAVKTIELKIDKWVYGGRGLGRLDGQAVMTPFVLPGETAQVDVIRQRKGLLEARLRRVTEPSAERREPICPYFTRCGGCHYQHASYESQLAGKLDVLRDVLLRVGKLAAPAEIEVIAGPPLEYRNRVQMHLSGGEIGFLAAASSRLCAVDKCPVASPAINRALEALRRMRTDRRFPNFVESIELFTNETGVLVNVLASPRPVARGFFDWCAESIPGASAGSLDYAAALSTYRVGHRSFFQVNRFLIERLIEAVVPPAGGSNALDLYAGVGLFTLPLARVFEAVTSVESSASAVRDLEFNAARAGVSVEAHRAPVEEYLEKLAAAPDFVLADPPRAGLGKSVVRCLLRLQPKRVTIVSCDPATMARDVQPLVAGGYAVRRMVLIDLFPQTCHIETVTELEHG